MKALLAAAALLWITAVPVSAASIRPEQAAAHVGEEITVEGVAWVHVKRTASFIDMGADFPAQSFQAVVFPDHADYFGDLQRFHGKAVAITGKIRMYNDIPEIILKDPAQLRTTGKH